MIKSKRYAAVVIAVLMLFVSLAAADPNTAEGSIISTSSVKVTQSATSSIVYGKVTKISGKKITLALGSKPSRPDKMKAKPSGTPKTASGSKSKTKPSGTPKMTGKAGSHFKTNGKTQKITVTSKTTIKARAKNGTATSSFSKIKINSILAFTYKNGNAISITIQNPGK